MPNRKTVYYPVLFALIVLLSRSEGFSQTIPVGSSLEEYYRNQQLLGKPDSSPQTNLRPYSRGFSTHKNDTSQLSVFLDSYRQVDNKQVNILPFIIKQQFNSTNAYGWNDGLMIPAKGYQAYLSAGAYVKYGPLSVQFNPEFVYTDNPVYYTDTDLAAAQKYETSPINSGGDIPLHYPGGQFTRLGYGQSSIRLTFDPISVGISNENLWWGPGRRSALIMSNNARGFKHITLNTTRPVNTPIGHVEGQVIAGRLDNSASLLNAPRVNEWRYLSGVVVVYHPKWINGLSVGLTRVFQMYNPDVKGLGDYFPLFQAFEKRRTDEDSKVRDQLTSVFARWIINGANAEVYFEYGRNDHSFSLRDLVQEPQHSRAYLVGFQKMVGIAGKPGEGIKIAAEITHMPQSLVKILRDAGTWYTHSQVNQGFTNEGEILGAGIGSGSSLQSVEVSWTKGLKKIGIQLERLEHNRDYYFEVIDNTGSLKSQWVDLSIGALVDWNYKNILISGKLLGVQSINYLWQSGINGTTNRDPFNLHANVGLAYFFRNKEQKTRSKD